MNLSFRQRIAVFKRWILTQNKPIDASDASFSGKVATVLMLGFGMATAFGITPGTSVRTTPAVSVVEELGGVMDGPTPTPGNYVQQVQIRAGDTLAALLFRAGVDDTSALDFIGSDPKARVIYQHMAPGRPLRVEHDAQGKLLTLRFPEGETSTLVVTRTGQGFSAGVEQNGALKRVVQASGTIQSSLFAAADGAGIPDSVTRQLTHLFSTDIDFHNDLRSGDTFSVVYEANQNDFDQLIPGRVLAAEFVNKGRVVRRVYFENSDGGDYYTPDGKGSKASFLRSPIEFTRITSGFSAARFHPILKQWRAHKGIDLAAPKGTPVVSVANATVAYAGWRNGYGNMIELHHGNGIDTVYGHLSAFANGIHTGSKIHQGDLIGFVGMTGWATGPHLHYEFKINGVQHDPLGPEVPRYASANVNAHNRAQFQSATAPLIRQLDVVRGSAQARFE
ncbi:MAG: M23 family metallopeptidase [Betaproteobacteria bacterium]|jgi:Membrane proteins related to metalloendopeptidases|nr:M23 family metallopeptidase [Betaproteobacteria bacterium]